MQGKARIPEDVWRFEDDGGHIVFDSKSCRRHNAYDGQNQGTYGTVWHVVSRDGDGEWAVKEFRKRNGVPDDEVREGRDHEASVLRLLGGAEGHAPRLLRTGLFFSGDDPTGRFAFAMDYAPGEALSNVVRRALLADEAGGLPSGETSLKAMRSICAAVSACHKALGDGRAHRDLKPSNINVELKPDSQTGASAIRNVVVLDWGQAPADVDLSMTPGRRGTPQYSSPELLRASGAKRDGRGLLPYERATVDVWSLGAIAFYLRTGQEPDFPLSLMKTEVGDLENSSKVCAWCADYREGHPLDLMRSLGMAEGAGGSFFDMQLSAFVGICTANDPDDRFQSADEAVEFIDGVFAQAAVPATTPALPSNGGGGARFGEGAVFSEGYERAVKELEEAKRIAADLESRLARQEERERRMREDAERAKRQAERAERRAREAEAREAAAMQSAGAVIKKRATEADEARKASEAAKREAVQAKRELNMAQERAAQAEAQTEQMRKQAEQAEARMEQMRSRADQTEARLQQARKQAEQAEKDLARTRTQLSGVRRKGEEARDRAAKGAKRRKRAIAGGVAAAIVVAGIGVGAWAYSAGVLPGGFAGEPEAQGEDGAVADTLAPSSPFAVTPTDELASEYDSLVESDWSLLASSLSSSDSNKVAVNGGISDAPCYPFSSDADSAYDELRREILLNPVYGIGVLKCLQSVQTADGALGDLNPWMGEAIAKNQDGGANNWIAYADDGETIVVSSEYRAYAAAACRILEGMSFEGFQQRETIVNWCLNLALLNSERELVESSYQYQGDCLVFASLDESGEVLAEFGFGGADKRPCLLA